MAFARPRLSGNGPFRFRPRLPLATMGLAATLLVAACSAPPFTQLSGLMLDAELDEVSGLAERRENVPYFLCTAAWQHR